MLIQNQELLIHILVALQITIALGLLTILTSAFVSFFLTVHHWILSCVITVYLLNMTASPMIKSVLSKETAMVKESIQRKCLQQKIVFNSVTQHGDAVGSPSTLWCLCVSFLKIAHPLMSPVKIVSPERGVVLMKKCQAQLKLPQPLPTHLKVTSY